MNIYIRKLFNKAVKGYRKVSNKKIENEKEITLPVNFSPTISSTPIPIRVPIEVEIEKKMEEKDKIEIEGITIPKKFKAIPYLPTTQQPKEFYISYPLIPKNPKPGEKVFAFVKIYWDKRKQSYFYEVIEPKLDEKMKEIIKKIKELIEQRLDIDLSKMNLIKAKEYLMSQIDDIIKYFKLDLTEEEIEIVRYYIERDFLGLGKIDVLMKDPNIEDISCDGVGIPIFVFHRDHRLGSLQTNIVFEDPAELDSFVIKLSQLAGKSISVTQPLVNGTLPDNSRLQATLATDIARRGSNFTIRKFIEEPLTPIHLIRYGTVDERMLAYLWLAVDYGRSILIAGGTASGKTTMLNILSLFIRPDKKIISIEDTAEIVLPHSHWISHVARAPISTGKEGEVDLFQLLKESLRQRPDYIVLGEVRGPEAYVLFQQMATGHPSFATIHAENLNKLIDRLTSPPISLPEILIGSLDVVIFMQRTRYKEKFVRRVTEIIEIVEFQRKEKLPIFNRIFVWNPFKDIFEIGEKSFILKKISKSIGFSDKDIIDEFQRRVAILRWMKEKNIIDFKDVYAILSAYYSMPNRILSLIESG
jgi:archaeal flagellar protein FlaI